MVVFDDYHTSIQGNSIQHWLERMNQRVEQARPEDELDLFLPCLSSDQ